ncbi:MAG: LEPR-XLL domain-containing protein, partial [Sedimentisphaerales bacterium]|nr:LEPR-XLL domain-containing protein [Sedimentisphaerales bacterium]
MFGRSKARKLARQGSTKPIVFEALEPRVLLSADSLANLALASASDVIPQGTDHAVRHAELLETPGQSLTCEARAVDEKADLPDDDSSASYTPIFTFSAGEISGESEDADLTDIGPIQTDEDASGLSEENTDAPANAAPVVEAAVEYETYIGRGIPTADAAQPILADNDNIRDLKSLPIEIRGPPENLSVPGLHIVEPGGGNFDGQVVYLDFDGEENVTYSGPVTISGLNVPAFSAPGDLRGHEQSVINSVLIQLEQTFSSTGVVFTCARPAAGGYSTVLVGGDDSAFAAYGSFAGLAEKVDIGNQDPCDMALVFSDVIAAGPMQGRDYAERLADVITHEIAHLLGYAHDTDDPAGGALADVAESVSGTITADTTWDNTGEPYRVTGDLTINPGVTLTIAEGVVVKFNGGRSMIVNGTLDARGTEAEPIIFTSYRDDSAGGDTNGDGPSSGVAGDWEALYFNSESDLSVLQNLELRFAGNYNSPGFRYGFEPAVQISDSDLTMINVSLSNCDSTG